MADFEDFSRRIVIITALAEDLNHHRIQQYFAHHLFKKPEFAIRPLHPNGQSEASKR
jgi:hypothetical protein